jgi:hypothetical protein
VKTRLLGLFLLCSLGLLSCTSNPGLASVPRGDWGGHNADLTVSDSGATALFKCGAAGQVAQPLSLDGSGRFTATGTYDPRLVLGGPRAATFSGALSGSHLQLSIQTADGAVGPFDLVMGQPASFDVCNFS